MQTHIVPVGFDYDRLIAPLVRDQRDVDRVILLEGAVGSEANVEYSRNLAEKLEKDFRNLLGAETERFVVEDVYDYDAAFEQVYDLISTQLDDGEGGMVHLQPERKIPVGSRVYRAAASGVRRRRACPSVGVCRRRVASPAGVRRLRAWTSVRVY